MSKLNLHNTLNIWENNNNNSELTGGYLVPGHAECIGQPEGLNLDTMNLK